MTEVLPADERGSLDRVARVLEAGGTVVLPTDTVYGLAVSARVPGATAKLFELKGRPAGVPIAVLVASLDQAMELAEPPPAPASRLTARLWPGPLTVVLTRRAGVAVDLGGEPDSVGVRCPDDEFVRELAARVGPLATTSANAHGRPTPAAAADAASSLVVPPDLVVDGGERHGVASTVVDGRDPALPLLREGPIPPEEIRAAALP